MEMKRKMCLIISVMWQCLMVPCNCGVLLTEKKQQAVFSNNVFFFLLAHLL